MYTELLLSNIRIKLNLSVKRKFVQFQVLEEAALDSPPFIDGGLSLGIEQERLPDRFLGLAQVVFHIDLWVPVLVPFNVVGILQGSCRNEFWRTIIELECQNSGKEEA